MSSLSWLPEQLRNIYVPLQSLPTQCYLTQSVFPMHPEFCLIFFQTMDTSIVCDDSDSEVFEVGNHTPAPQSRISESSHDQASSDARINSSSSSSCDDKGSRSLHESPEPMLDSSTNTLSHTVSGQTVEWRPSSRSHGGLKRSSSGSRRSRKTPSDDLQSPPDNLHESAAHSGTVTVMIDPPNDEQQLFSESAGDIGSSSKIVFRRPSASEEETVDLFANLDDSDSEGEETEGTAVAKTCLLSR